MMIDQMIETVKITVRNLPKPLHARLKKVAEQNRHSLNDEVVIAIEEHIGVSHRAVSGYIWCDQRGSIHNDSLNPYDDGVLCEPINHSPIFCLERKPAPKRAKDRKP